MPTDKDFSKRKQEEGRGGSSCEEVWMGGSERGRTWKQAIWKENKRKLAGEKSCKNDIRVVICKRKV
jgi:hypothetical protein